MRKIISTVARCIVAAVAVTGLVTAGSQATAAEAASGGDFCELSAATGQLTCYRTEAELRDRPSAAVTYIWARLFDLPNLDPDNGYIEVTHTRLCTASYADVDTSRLDLGSWRNRISSLTTHFTPNPKCDVKLYDRVNFGGDSSVWISHCLNLATCIAENWNNRADSVKIS